MMNRQVRLRSIQLLLLLLSYPSMCMGQISESAERIKTFVNHTCIECHASDAPEAGLDLSSLELQASDPANRAQWIAIYDRVSAGEMPPVSSAQPDASLRNQWLQTLAAEISDAELALERRMGRSGMRRLNRAEYELTVQELLHVDVPLKEILPEDSIAHGFDKCADGLRISAAQIERYLDAATLAIDYAIQLGPAPEQKIQRFRYHDEKEIIENLSKPHGKEHKRLFREHADALVFISPGWSPNVLRQFHAEHEGRYKVRMSGYGYRTDGKDVVMQLLSTNWKREKLLGYFVLPADKPAVVETEIELRDQEAFLVQQFNVGNDKEGKSIWQYDNFDDVDVPGVAVEWIEFEGPLMDGSWPPKSTVELFGADCVRKLERTHWQDGKRIEFEIVANDPKSKVQSIIAQFAAKAFRRSYPTDALSRETADAVAPYVQLALNALEDGKSFEEAVRMGIRAVLVSPRFIVLYHLSSDKNVTMQSAAEFGNNPLAQNVNDSQFATAERLAYFLWGRGPDKELLQLAQRGELTTPKVLEQQIERLLDDARSTQFHKDFLGQWLDLRSIDATAPDTRLYPEYDVLLKDAMLRETEAFFAELVRENLPIRNLIDSDFAMVNGRLAEHYGLQLARDGTPGDHIRRVTLPSDSPRGGILTQASVLKVTANGTTTSPVRRGVWVQSRLLGDEPPPPPPVPAIEPDIRGATTIREQLAKHRSSDACNSCHKEIDPPGFALESFDVIGGFRKRYRSDGGGDPIKVHVGTTFFWAKEGPAVDCAGQLPDGQSFAGIDDFKKLLLEREDEVIRCLAEKLVIYSTGAAVRFVDRQAIDEIVNRTKRDGSGTRTLIKHVVLSPLFLKK